MWKKPPKNDAELAEMVAGLAAQKVVDLMKVSPEARELFRKLPGDQQGDILGVAADYRDRGGRSQIDTYR